MQPNELTKRFTTSVLDNDQAGRAQKVRALTLDYARSVCELLPEGREESLFVTNLEQASFFAIKAISRESA